MNVKHFFLPTLIISDGTPVNETQFLCRVQVMDAIENFYCQVKGRMVLSKVKENKIGLDGYFSIRTDILIKDMESRQTLITNLIQYTPPTVDYEPYRWF